MRRGAVSPKYQLSVLCPRAQTVHSHVYEAKYTRTNTKAVHSSRNISPMILPNVILTNPLDTDGDCRDTHELKKTQPETDRYCNPNCQI